MKTPGRDSGPRQISHQSHSFPSTDKLSRGVSSAPKESDAQISELKETQISGHRGSSLAETGRLSLRRENVHGRLSSSSDEDFRRLRSGSARSTTATDSQSASSISRHGRSGSRAEPGFRQDRTSSTGRDHSRNRSQRPTEDGDHLSDSRRRHPGSDSRNSSRQKGSISQRPGSGDRQSSLRDRGKCESLDRSSEKCRTSSIERQERLGSSSFAGDDQKRSGDKESSRDKRASLREHSSDRKKHEDDDHTSGKRRTSRSERDNPRQPDSSSENVNKKPSANTAASKGADRRLADDVFRLSMAGRAGQTSKDRDSGGTEYQPVLTRHVNQLFIRGDNVALVAVLS